MAMIQLTDFRSIPGRQQYLYFRPQAIDAITERVDENPRVRAVVYVRDHCWQVLESPTEIQLLVDSMKRTPPAIMNNTLDAANEARDAAKQASADLNNLKTALNAFGQDLQALRRQVDEIERKLSRLGAQNIDLHKTVDAQSSELVKLRSLIDGDGS